MNHTELLKRALSITWRYRPLWVFGFFLALCSGGGGGNGGGNFNPGGGDFGQPSDVPNMSDIDPGLIIAVVAGLCCLILLLTIIGVIVRAVTRTALIRMVQQITQTEAVTIKEGLQLGWSRGAWRVFLVSLVIGIPMFIVTISLLLLAFVPFFILMGSGEFTLIMGGFVIAMVAFLCVILLLFIVSLIVWPIQELAWRQTVLNDKDVFSSFGDTFKLIREHFKDVFVLWLLMMGIGIGWGFVALLVVLPAALIVAFILGGIPAGLVYLITNSVVGAAVAGGPLALIALIGIISFGTGLYLTFQSSFWTLAHLEWQSKDETPPPDPSPDPPPDSDDNTLLSLSPSET